MHDYGTGLEMKSFSVTADFAIEGVPAWQNLADRFKLKSQGVWEWLLEKPIAKLPHGRLTISVADRQGNIGRVERTFSVGE